VIGLVHTTAAGRTGCARLAAAWPGRTRTYEGGSVRELVARAFAECDQLVLFLATGAAVRLLAPLLTAKAADPAVVTVDEAHRHAVALLGGHAAGANALAADAAAVLGASPVVTTATDATATPALDTLPYPAEGAIPAVTRAMLDGTPVHLVADATWPLPPLALTPAPGGPPSEQGFEAGAAAGGGGTAGAVDAAAGPGGYVVRVTDRVVPPARHTVLVRPPSLVVGVGGSRGVAREEVVALVHSALEAAGLAGTSVWALASVDAKAGEAGIVGAARHFGVDLLTYPAERLARVPVPNPSDAPLAAVGTPSVAEAAALCGAGVGGELVVEKRKSAMATVAVARRRPRGRLAVVGLGPGARDLLTPRAAAELRRASVVVGLDQYVEQVRDLLPPGTRVLASGLGAEETRARTAVAQARAGHAVALIGSGDAGVYAMASPALAEAADDIDVVGVPGVTAALAAAALLGAPLGHDHVSISLSDLHTPWEVIERRVRAAAESDLVVTFYNPRSRGRSWQLPKALALLAEHRPAGTPVGVVRSASRPDEQVTVTTLAGVDPETVDMVTVVTVGNTASRVVAGRMVTPRGYRWQQPAASPAPAPPADAAPPRRPALGDAAAPPRPAAPAPAPAPGLPGSTAVPGPAAAPHTPPAAGTPHRREAAGRRVHPIEQESYRILRSRLDTSHLPPLTRAVLERVVHASADPGYATELVADEAELAAAHEALLAGAPVVADVAMVAAGITRREVVCRLRDASGGPGLTRSAHAVRLAYEQVGPGAVWVVGCAPTALEELIDLGVAPALVIGMPVGFVGAAESKARLRASGLPAVSNVSEKGGSAVAAAALNALLYTAPAGPFPAPPAASPCRPPRTTGTTSTFSTTGTTSKENDQ
jgi:cobalt-precorrin 5A hydrolase/precorrin-3B C17-methyltransferase